MKLLILILSLFFACSVGYASPNILFILADDMGYGDLRCHGNDMIDTPQLDKLQSQSVVLDRFFVSPLCSPTRASLLTGRHHVRLGVLSTTAGLEVVSGEEMMLPEVLKGAGYATACFGKWHNGSNHPSTARGQGFDEFFGFSGGFTSNYFDAELEHNDTTVTARGFITDALTDAAVKWIAQHQQKPFFCYVPFNACHSPMQAPQELFEKYRARGFEAKDAAIYAMIDNLDTNVGRLLAAVDGTDTLVVFTTDNGPNSKRFNDGMRGIKGTVFEGGSRVPCFIRWTGKLTPGKRIRRFAQHIDMMPTLLDLVGIEHRGDYDGISLAPLLKGEAKTWPTRQFYDLAGQSGPDGETIRKHPGTVRTQTHRWVHDGKTAMLFDMTKGAGTLVEQPALAAKLAADYDKWFAAMTSSTQGKFRRFPITLTAGTDLLAPSAIRHGQARFFGNGWDNDWLTGFETEGDSATWTLEVPQPGDYDITALHTATNTGGSVRVKVGSATVQTTITTVCTPAEIPRPDLVPRWEVPDKRFAPLKLGTLTIPAGKHVLELRAAPGIEIQALRLRRR